MFLRIEPQSDHPSTPASPLSTRELTRARKPQTRRELPSPTGHWPAAFPAAFGRVFGQNAGQRRTHDGARAGGRIPTAVAGSGGFGSPAGGRTTDCDIRRPHLAAGDRRSRAHLHVTVKPHAAGL